MPFLRKTALLTASVLIAAGFAANSIYANPPALPEAAAAVASQNYLKTIPWDAEYDVVVIGYGFAGGAAAIAAADAGAKVLSAGRPGRRQQPLCRAAGDLD